MQTRTSSTKRIPRLADSDGLTLIEVLVCMIIVRIIAAIALPSFLDQRRKAQDTEAKVTVATATSALLTHLTEKDTFDATTADLEAIEPALRDARNLDVQGTTDSYELSVDSANGTRFTLKRDAANRLTRECSAPSSGLCRLNPDAAGNRW